MANQFIYPEEVAKMVEQGLYDKEIADRLNCSPTRILEVRVANNIPAGRNVASGKLKAKMGVLIANGKTIREISEALDVPVGTIARWRVGMVKPKRQKPEDRSAPPKMQERRIDA